MCFGEFELFQPLLVVVEFYIFLVESEMEVVNFFGKLALGTTGGIKFSIYQF